MVRAHRAGAALCAAGRGRRAGRGLCHRRAGVRRSPRRRTGPPDRRGRLGRPTRVHPCHGRRRHPPHDRARDRRCHPARRRRRDHRGHRRLSGRRAAVRHRRGRPPAAVFVRRACAVADRRCADRLCSRPAAGGRHLPCRGHHTVPRPDRRTAGGRPFAGQGRAV